MSDALATYVHDHLAGSVVAVDILEALCDPHVEPPIRQVAVELLLEVEQDRAVLRELAERVSAKGDPIKEAVAWVGEKVSRLKLRRGAAGQLGTFESLEALGLGVLGKLALWRALAIVAPVDERLHGVDFDALCSRAQEQHDRLERLRLETAVVALAG